VSFVALPLMGHPRSPKHAASDWNVHRIANRVLAFRFARLRSGQRDRGQRYDHRSIILLSYYTIILQVWMPIPSRLKSTIGLRYMFLVDNKQQRTQLAYLKSAWPDIELSSYRESAFYTMLKSRILTNFENEFSKFVKIWHVLNLTLICISFIVQQITLIYLPNVICQSFIGTKAMLSIAYC